jgi:hypothetical protein
MIQKLMIKELAEHAGIPSDEVFAKDSVEASMIAVEDIDSDLDKPA